MFIAVLFAAMVALPTARALEAGRENAISGSMDALGTSEVPAELAPIRLKVQEIVSSDEFVLARALHLYNQRRLNDAKSQLQDVLIENPHNHTAVVYLDTISAKRDAVNPPKALLEDELKGIASVEKGSHGGAYGKEEFGTTDGHHRITTNTMMGMTKNGQAGEDLVNKTVMEAVKLEGSLSEYKYTATANINYYSKGNVRDDTRLRNATWWMKNDKLQFIAGDTSSYLSRFILTGVNYRGLNLRLDAGESMFGNVKDKIVMLYGKIPYFYLTKDEYIYPRQIAGARNELALGDNFNFNTTFAYIWDNDSRMKKIDLADKGKRNALLGFDETFRVIPGVWTLNGESAFSYADEDIAADNKILRSSANYLVSDFKTKTLKIYNSYERIHPNFRSYLGIGSYSASNMLTIDRENIINSIDYQPREEVDLGLHYSRTRTNLNKRYNVQTIQYDNYRGAIKLMPKNGLPRFTLRGSIWNSDNGPGPFAAPQNESSWDSVFEVAKKYAEIDWAASYGVRGYNQFLNETNTYGDAREQTFSLSANKRFYDRIEITPSYSLGRATLLKTPNRGIYTTTIMRHLFDLHLSSGLWDTANVTFDYSYERAKDFATPSLWGTNNGFTTTFSWPFTTTLGYRKKFVFSPFLSYHYASGTVNYYDRSYFASRLEGDYFLTENTKLNISGEYRSNVVTDPTYCGYGDEYRVFISYKTVNGF
ncbi:MAG: hypothetical protein WCG78_00575 [Candidatus Omnitrophota bacterium]